MINEDVQDEESVNILVRKRDETYMIISKDDAKKLSSEYNNFNLQHGYPRCNIIHAVS
jgi:hypothetical protein